MTAALNPILNPPEFRPGAGFTDEMLADKLAALLTHPISGTMINKELMDELKYIPDRLRWLGERLSRFEDAFNMPKSTALEVTANLKSVKERLFIVDLLGKNGFSITHTIGRTDSDNPLGPVALMEEPEIMVSEGTEDHNPPRRFIHEAWMEWKVLQGGIRHSKELRSMALLKIENILFPTGKPHNVELVITNEVTNEFVIEQRVVNHI